MTKLTMDVPSAEERELLDLAAKAADLSSNLKWDHRGFHRYDNQAPWNPLADDGDALRLAVKLNLHEAIKLAHRLVDDRTDFYAAARLSIVRAAAEIGRTKA